MTRILDRDFEHGIDAGLIVGFQEGWSAGFDACDAEYQAWLGVAKQTLSLPTVVDLMTARMHTNEPCQAKCRKCSRCTRYIAAWRNERVTGDPDYCGGRVEWEPNLDAAQVAS